VFKEKGPLNTDLFVELPGIGAIAPLRDWLDVDPVVQTVFSSPVGVPSTGLNHGVGESS
jgi:hypothetical protein